MTSNLPVNTANIIARSVRTTFHVRYVVCTEVDDILAVLCSHPGAHGFKDIEIFGENQLWCAAARQNTDNVWVKREPASLKKVLTSL